MAAFCAVCTAPELLDVCWGKVEIGSGSGHAVFDQSNQHNESIRVCSLLGMLCDVLVRAFRDFCGEFALKALSFGNLAMARCLGAHSWAESDCWESLTGVPLWCDEEEFESVCWDCWCLQICVLTLAELVSFRVFFFTGVLLLCVCALWKHGVLMSVLDLVVCWKGGMIMSVWWLVVYWWRTSRTFRGSSEWVLLSELEMCTAACMHLFVCL